MCCKLENSLLRKTSAFEKTLSLTPLLDCDCVSQSQICPLPSAVPVRRTTRPQPDDRHSDPRQQTSACWRKRNRQKYCRHVYWGALTISAIFSCRRILSFEGSVASSMRAKSDLKGGRVDRTQHRQIGIRLWAANHFAEVCSCQRAAPSSDTFLDLVLSSPIPARLHISLASWAILPVQESFCCAKRRPSRARSKNLSLIWNASEAGRMGRPAPGQ